MIRLVIIFYIILLSLYLSTILFLPIFQYIKPHLFIAKYCIDDKHFFLYY